MSAALSTVLMIGMASTLWVALQSSSRDFGPFGAIIDTGVVAETIERDLAYATDFQERNAATVEFTVPDRDSDGVEETIRYSWGGNAGDPLTRTLNSGTAKTVLDDLHSFALKYHTLDIDLPESTTGERQLVTPDLTVNANIDIGPLIAGGCFVKPDMPANTTEWEITRVEILIEDIGGATSTMDARIHNGSWGLVEAVNINESDLPSSLAWYEIDFTSADGLPPDTGAYFTLVKTSLGIGTAGRIQAGAPNVDTPETHRIYSSDGGLIWLADTSRDLNIRIFGKYTTGGPTTLQQTVEFSIQVGADSSSVLHGTVANHSQPALP